MEALSTEWYKEAIKTEQRHIMNLKMENHTFIWHIHKTVNGTIDANEYDCFDRSSVGTDVFAQPLPPESALLRYLVKFS